MADQSEIIHHASGSVTFIGPDATRLMGAMQLWSALRLYQKTGIKMSHDVGLMTMLRAATRITQRKYRTADIQQAIDDLRVWIDTMKAALPTTVEEAK